MGKTYYTGSDGQVREVNDTVKGLATGIIIVIALSVFFFVVVVPLLACILVRKRHKRQALRNTEAAEAMKMSAHRAAHGISTVPPNGTYGHDVEQGNTATSGVAPAGYYTSYDKGHSSHHGHDSSHTSTGHGHSSSGGGGIGSRYA